MHRKARVADFETDGGRRALSFAQLKEDITMSGFNWSAIDWV
jgi:hypothetical protein